MAIIDFAQNEPSFQSFWVGDNSSWSLPAMVSRKQSFSTPTRVESRTGAVALVSRWLLTKLSRRRLSPVGLGSVSCSRSSNRTGGFPASGSRKRRTLFCVTPSATSEHNDGAARPVVNPHVLRCLLRPSLTEIPSLRRSYPASSVLRISPPPHTARPVSHELPVDPY
jgi:hypothetical protein